MTIFSQKVEVRKQKRRFWPRFSHVGQAYNFCHEEKGSSDLHIRLYHAHANNTAAAAVVLLNTLTLAYFHWLFVNTNQFCFFRDFCLESFDFDA